jgi:rubrerythrin
VIGATKVDTREELINALTEAAELEHGLLCQYLFAAFSMKKHPSEDVTWPQLELIRDWEGHILRVAREEMAHLGTVSNLLTAVGGASQFRRPNFPQPARYFPTPSAGSVEYVEFTLEPFSISALDRFIRFEMPEEELRVGLEAIAPDPIEYVTVGDLYGQIREAFETLDERQLFIGPRMAQDTDDWSANLRLRNVVDRPTAVEAINDIIEEGEAAPKELPTSHWATFVRVREELDNEIKQNPDFDPARPVVSNPLTRPHRDSSPGATIVRDPNTLEIAELFNAIYGTMVLMLMQFYAFAGEAPEQREGLRATIRQTMSGVVRPLGEILTQMPARADLPGKTAGPGFEFYTDLRVPSSRKNSWIIIHERLAHEARACKRLAQRDGAPQRLAFLHENLEGLARNVQRYMNIGEL